MVNTNTIAREGRSSSRSAQLGMTCGGSQARNQPMNRHREGQRTLMSQSPPGVTMHPTRRPSTSRESDLLTGMIISTPDARHGTGDFQAGGLERDGNIDPARFPRCMRPRHRGQVASKVACARDQIGAACRTAAGPGLSGQMQQCSVRNPTMRSCVRSCAVVQISAARSTPEAGGCQFFRWKDNGGQVYPAVHDWPGV